MALLRLTDIAQAQSTAITPTTLVHIVTTGDTSQNGAGSSYKAELSQIYDGLSGYCMPQILTSFVIPCSPLGISPNDEGNVYFGSTSGLTVDVVNNRVGIGTSTPSVKLQVKGIDDTSSNTSFLVETSGATPLFSVRNDGFSSVYNASQQFGEKLSVNGTVLAGTSGYLIQDGGIGYWQMYSSGNVFGIGKNALTSPIFGIDVTNPYYIFTQSAYNFGVGISTPSAKLHVNNTTSNNTVLFEDDTNPDSTPFVIDNTGRVGIGTTTPSKKLEVIGDSLINSFILGRGNGDNINNIAFGKDALFTNTGGTRNTAIGYESLYSVLSNNDNTSIGYQTLRNNVGSDNTAVGSSVLYSNTTGTGNVGVGRNSLYANQTGNNNIAIDGATGALVQSVSGNQNISIGGYSLYVQNGVSGSVAIGWASLYQNVSGTGNSAVGFESLRVATGNNNTAFGYYAGTTHTTGNNNTFIGNNTDSTTTGITNSTAIGYNTKTSQSNTVILGNSADVGIGTATPSSKLEVVGTTKSSTISATTYQNLPTEIQVAASDETTALTTGTAKVTFRMPYAMTVTEVRGSLTTAQASGNIFTVDINESGISILSTKLTIDNTEKTSVTAATPPVISDTSLADDAEITVDIDQIGDGTATGLKITIKGFRA